MCIDQSLIDTHPTRITVFEIFFPTNSTETTIGTVVWLFFVGHPQIANSTMVFTELGVTFHAIIRFTTLSGVTNSTSHFPYREPVNTVVRIFLVHRYEGTG